MHNFSNCHFSFKNFKLNKKYHRKYRDFKEIPPIVIEHSNLRNRRHSITAKVNTLPFPFILFFGRKETKERKRIFRPFPFFVPTVFSRSHLARKKKRNESGSAVKPLDKKGNLRGYTL